MLEHGIKMGRDGLFEVLRINGLLIRKTKKATITTNSKHLYRKYKNLIKGYVPAGANHIWVSDLTYWKVDKGFYYVSLITDAYSRKIVGYEVAMDLESIHSINALNKAILSLDKHRPASYPLIHHSDRGIQYCCHGYVNKLLKNNIHISMTESGDPLDNAIAERVNGILKNEYLIYKKPKNLQEAKFILSEAVDTYNKTRPHLSLGMLKPEFVHQYQDIKIENLWNKKLKNKKFVNQSQDNLNLVNQ